MSEARRILARRARLRADAAEPKIYGVTYRLQRCGPGPGRLAAQPRNEYERACTSTSRR